MSERVAPTPSSCCPTEILTGCCPSWHRVPAKSWTSFGQVAEKKSMCLSVRMADAILVTSSWKPQSNILSASSSTKYVTRSKETSLFCMRSISRPGVATRMWTPRHKFLTCSDFCLPPYTTDAQMPPGWFPSLELAINLYATSWIWTASSLVGAMTSAIGVAPFLAMGLDASMCTRAGRRYARVLPLPVLAIPIRSCPCRMMGKACAWIGMGVVHSISSRHFMA
mmetsp:Transcript_88103/g.196992  ORF Transcript_88103/g.196992 Transcript_88103/m.196992 type:complete len:224 (-) Transcript_88103:432-1103(-)